MPVVTLSEAAAALGFRSRSTLYRLRDAGQLERYLRPPAGKGGAQRLELEPPGLPSLAVHVGRLIAPRINTPQRTRSPRPDPRWDRVAAGLSLALTDCGGLQLAAAEAETIARMLPLAVGDAFGADGLERLRVALADTGCCWRAGPGTPDNPDADREWWGDDGWGRWEPGEPLETAAFWDHVGQIVAGMMGGPFEQLSGDDAAELHLQLQEAIGAVEAGARFDPVRWASASLRTLLEDPDAEAGCCPHSRPELERLAAGGLLPPDLQAQAEAALERYRANDQQQQQQQAGEALPVVVSD